MLATWAVTMTQQGGLSSATPITAGGTQAERSWAYNTHILYSGKFHHMLHTASSECPHPLVCRGTFDIFPQPSLCCLSSHLISHLNIFHFFSLTRKNFISQMSTTIAGIISCVMTWLIAYLLILTMYVKQQTHDSINHSRCI